MTKFTSSVLFSSLLFTLVRSQMQVLPSGTVANTSATTLPGACIKALEATVQCPEILRDISTADYFFGIPDSTFKSTCTKACDNSLATYHKNVETSCGKNSKPWPGYPGPGYPATYYGDQLWSSFNLTCLTDPSTGASCMSYIYKTSQSYKSDMAATSLPKNVVCSPCIIAMYKLLQSTPFSGYGLDMASDWAKIQKICGKSFPTSPPANPANVSDPAFVSPGYPVTSGCYSGTMYKAVSGDSCRSISKIKSVSTGGIIALNDLFFDCGNLRAGQSLCLPQKCTTYTVQSSDSCESIINASGIEYTQFLAWNPLIDPYCSNLVTGWSVCTSQPGAVYTGTTIDGATVTQTAIYATTTVPPPNNIARGTTKKCGQYYSVQSGDNCSLIALNYTISVDLFEAINPSIDAGCTNLTPGLSYCVFPTADWNSTTTTTTTSTYVTAPAATPSGTTNKCYEWHKVGQGDYCGLIQQQYDITMAQLQFWNPNLKDDCSNLILGDAYCVHGDGGPTMMAAAAARTTSGKNRASTAAATTSDGKV